MRSMLIALGGIALFGICVLAVRLIGGDPDQAIDTAVKVFLPSWLILVGVNAWYGVSRLDFPVSEEVQIGVAIFLVPAAVAGVTWWKFAQ